MKKASLLLISLFIMLTAFSQEEKKHKLPSVEIKNVNGIPFNSADIDNDGKPVIISFWAMWCKPCIRELNTIADVYPDWQEETGVRFYAVSIDDVRSSSKVLPFANGNDWGYEILLDPNKDFARAMNVNLIPHMFILDGEGNIVWQHTSFAEGGELEVIETVRRVAAGEDVSE
ncbi:MAG: TlpA disulfide reductase family protein [Bacteroidota bacterium]|nr:TlpA disulfide reductase family protein [Bacteroidota bacterium]